MNIYTASSYEGEIEIPASKSQTIRAFLIATFAQDESIIRHPLISSDTLACIKACQKLGAKINFNEDKSIANVDSRNALKDLNCLSVDCQNSGTTEYLLLPLLSTLSIPCSIFGDEMLNNRPVLPLANSLTDLGAKIETNNGRPPVKVLGPLKGGETVIECKTSQYLSGLLLASPLSKGDTTITCSLLYEKPYVEMTLSWLRAQNISFEISDDLEKAKVKGGQKYTGFDAYINGDFSSASFFFALATICKTKVKIKGLDRSDKQGDKAILDILEKMGSKIEWEDNSVTVTGPEEIKGGTFDLNSIPDTLPILSVVAAFSKEKVHLTNVPQARIKETDRIKVMCENLKKVGVSVIEEEDGMIIEGGKVKGAKVKGYNDHRIIMALAVMSARTEGVLEIDNIEAVSVTFPTFFEIFDSLRRSHV